MFFRSLFVLAGLVGSAAAQTPAGTGRYVPGSDLDGTWEGILTNGGMGFPVVFVIATTPNGGTRATVDIMDTASEDIPVAEVRRKDMSLVLDVPAVGGTFDGLVSADLATISGRWTQKGATGGPVPLILRRKAP